MLPKLGLDPSFLCWFFFSVLKLLQKIWKTLQKHFQVLSHIETFGKMFLRHFWAVPCTEGTFSVSKNYVLLLWDPPSNIKKKSTKGNTWKNNIQIEIQICHQMKNLQYFWKILIYSFNFYFQFPCFEISFLIACPLWKLYPFLYLCWYSVYACLKCHYLILWVLLLVFGTLMNATRHIM